MDKTKETGNQVYRSSLTGSERVRRAWDGKKR